jgi:PPP family 3-phenylpropionic acid transporter
MDSKTKLRILSLSCLFNMGAFNLMSSFITIYLKNCGLNETQIGSIGAWATLFSLFLTFMIGSMADRLQASRLIVIVLFLVHGLSSFLYIFARGYFHFLGLGVLRGVAYASTSSIIPLLVLSVLPGQAKGRHYSSYRKWGSVGYFSFAVIGGYFAERFGINPLFAASSLFFIIAAIMFSIAKTDAPATRPRGTGISRIFSNPPLVILYFALIPFALWGPVCFRFLPLYMRELGGSYTLVGYLMGSMGLFGIIGLPIVGRLTDRYGVVPIIALNFLLVPLRLILYPLIHNPYWIFIPNLIHILNFPINEICFLLFVERYCAPELRNTAMVLIIAFRALGGIAGSYFGGYWAQNLGYPMMFHITAVICILGFIIFSLGIRKTVRRAT